MASILGPSEEKTNGTKLARLLIDGGTLSVHAQERVRVFHTSAFNTANYVKQQQGDPRQLKEQT